MIIKIAITDDHEMVLKGLETMLENTKEITIVGTYKDAKSTLEGLSKIEPDVLLLDINLPDISGLDLSKTLLKKYPELKIIALTNFEDVSFVKRMLKKGVHGYLLKNTDRIELIEALQTVLSGELYLQKNIQKALLGLSSKNKSKSSLIINLTRREQDVLVAISEQLTTQEISEKLFISPKTVETHRMNIRSKLGARNSVGIIKKAIENNLL